MFFGFIPAKVLHYFGTRKSILIGGAVLSLCQLVASKIVNGEPDLILRNGYLTACCIGGIAGQGACLIFLATTQALLTHSTVIASALVSMVLLVFYLGSDSRTFIGFRG